MTDLRSQSPPAPEVVDNPRAPEVYANDASFFATLRGVVTIVFTVDRFDYTVQPPHLRRVVVHRLVMPSRGAQNLAVGLYDWLKKSGLDPAPAPAGDVAPASAGVRASTLAPPPRPAPETVDDLLMPEVFANEASFFSSNRDTVTLVLTSDRFDHGTAPQIAKRVVVERLVMPARGAQNLAVGLYGWLKRSGLDPVPAASRDKPQ
jgi:hypothetical protein